MIGVVGTGNWAGRLAEGAARAGLEVVSCYARTEESRNAFAEAHGCEAAPSLDALLDDERVQGVILASPNDLHAEQAIAAAGRRKHVFAEKPVAHTLEAGRRMAAACEAAGVALQVGHEFRRLGAARKAKELVESGALGRVVLAEANFSLAGTVKPGTWKAERRRNPGTPLIQLGIHHADTLAYLLGPVASTTGKLARVAIEADVDDVAVASLVFESGALGAITGSYISPKTYSLRLLGTDAVLDYATDMSVWPRAERLDEVTTLTVDREPVAFEPVDPLADELAEFGRCIRGEAEPETGAAEGLAALEVVLEAIG